MKIKISSPSGLGAATQVELDGKPCHTLSAVRFDLRGGDGWAMVDLEAIMQGFEYEGEAVVGVGEETAALLRKLGWREPEPAFKDEDKVPDEG